MIAVFVYDAHEDTSITTYLFAPFYLFVLSTI